MTSRPIPDPPTSPLGVPFSRRTALAALAGSGVLLSLGDGRFLTGRAEAAVPGRPVIPPLPSSVTGVGRPGVPLPERWRYHAAPPASFWSPSTSLRSWTTVKAPGEPALQGEVVESGREQAYAVDLDIPADFVGRRIFLRFDGVYSHARVWVDGTLVREHDGGFTTWYAEVTKSVTPGRPVRVVVGVTDRPDTIAGQSDYAKHLIGGVLRPVTLVALPVSHLTRTHVETTFDSSFTDATLTLTVAADVAADSKAVVTFALSDPDGKRVPLTPSRTALTAREPQRTLSAAVRAPAKWDAEHPNLYTLTTTLTADGVTETVTQQVGFRQVEVRGNELLVNGAPVHLLGVDHHSISESGGRSASAALDAEAARLYKEANCNFVRTSHYPPTPAFLDEADRIGLYVEVESPVCFQYDTVDDAAFNSQYLSQYAEMVERDRSRACVVEWSLGNESGYGRNFADENAYSQVVDTARPTVFEPAQNDNGGPQADIYSGHYPSLSSSNGNATQPIQYGEFAHVPCYNTATLKVDPGVRDYWGVSIARHAHKFRTTDGVVGGAIWAAIDEVFHLPAGPTGYGEWGVIDLWRRRKPEFWHTKKAFSPIQIVDGVLAGQTPGAAISVPVTNWYDHTNLSELTFTWSVGSRSGRIADVDVAPRATGTLVVPAGAWTEGDRLRLTAKRGSTVVDDWNLWLGTRVAPRVPAPGGRAPKISDADGQITVTGVAAPFTVVFDKDTGRLVQATADGDVVLVDGPDLMLSRQSAGAWVATAPAEVVLSGGRAVVTLSGRFGSLDTEVLVSIDGRGLLTTTYTVAQPPTSAQSEVGIAWTAPGSADTFSWDRDGQWTVYPEDHIGRPVGTATATRTRGTDRYRGTPSWPWGEDTHSYFLFGRDSVAHWTNDFRSTKSGVRTAKLTQGRSGPGVRVESAGTDAVRLLPEPPTYVDDASSQVVYAGDWTHADPSDSYTAGDIEGTESFSDQAGATAALTFVGTGVEVYAAKASNLGIVEILLDGELQETADLYASGKTTQMVWRSAALTDGEHVVQMRVTGTKNPSASAAFGMLDAFRVLSAVTEDEPPRIRVLTCAVETYPDLAWGNYWAPPVTLPAGYSATASLRLLGS